MRLHRRNKQPAHVRLIYGEQMFQYLRIHADN